MSKNTQKLLKLIDLVGQQIHEKVCDLDEVAYKFSLSQLKVLKLVWLSEAIAMTDIAKHLKIKPASATSLVDRLVQQGWLERKADDNDRRKVYISLVEDKKTEWGVRHEKEMKKMADYMSALNESQSEEFINILETLVNQDS